jgi:uncharacterized protein
MDSPFMAAVAAGLAGCGITVVRFEFPYMAARRTGTRPPPNRMPALEASYRAVVASLPRSARLFVGGKSMGSRVAVQLVDALAARGAIALGYPFHPPKQPSKLRLEPLRAAAKPCLLVQGTRDPLGSPLEVASYALPRHVELHWLDDGDHSFAPRKSSGRTLQQNLAEAVRAVAAFIART